MKFGRTGLAAVGLSIGLGLITPGCGETSQPADAFMSVDCNTEHNTVVTLDLDATMAEAGRDTIKVQLNDGETQIAVQIGKAAIRQDDKPVPDTSGRTIQAMRHAKLVAGRPMGDDYQGADKYVTFGCYSVLNN